jgi:hypothetical protein
MSRKPKAESVAEIMSDATNIKAIAIISINEKKHCMQLLRFL